MKHSPQVKPLGHTAKAWRTGKPGTAPMPIASKAFGTKARRRAAKSPFAPPKA